MTVNPRLRRCRRTRYPKMPLGPHSRELKLEVYVEGLATLISTTGDPSTPPYL